MAVKRVRNNISYSPFGSPYAGYQQLPVISERNPSSSDIAELGTVWVNRTTGAAYILTFVAAGSATWTSIAATSGSFTSLTVNPGDIVATAGNIEATAGDVTAGNDMIAAGNITATAGDITATAGNMVAGGDLEAAGNLNLTTAGSKLLIADGADASVGQATLVAGTFTVATTAITTDSLVFLTCAAVGGTQGILSVSNIVNGVSFDIDSSEAADTSTVNYLIIN